jgi:hypothetical protein
MRWCLMLIVLAACSQQAAPSAMTIPTFRRGCHAPAIDPKPLPPVRTLEQFKKWSDETAHARDIDKLSLLECERKLDEVLTTLDTVRDQSAH